MDETNGIRETLSGLAFLLAHERRQRLAAEEALRASDERYQDHVENANDVVFSIDLQGNFTSLNRAGEQVSGYTRSELRTMNIQQVLAPESLGLALQMIQQKLVDHRPTTYELQIVARDGHRVPLEVSTRLLTHGGTPVGVQGIARDITERTRAAEALRESEQRYRGLFESASDIVYTHDLEGNFTSVNRATQEVIGYSRDEVLHMNIDNVVAPEHLARAQDMIRRKLRSGEPTTYELDVLTRDGKRVTLEINSQLIYQHGQPIGVQGIARDVTERRRAEAEVRSRERKQASVAELGQRALASGDLQSLFDETVRCVAETLDLEFCTVTELLEDKTKLLARAGVGWRPGLLGTATVDAGVGSQAGFTLLSSEPVIVEDLSVETRFTIPDVLKEHAVRSGVSVIIHGQGQPFGVLSAFSPARRVFTQDDVHFLQSVSNVLATAIERTRLEEARAQQSMQLTTLVLHAQEEERKRIARELHDETAQSLSTLLMHLDLLEPHIPPSNDLLKAGFQRVRGLARRTLDETRALSHDLRPTILDDVGLSAALQWYAEEYERSPECRLDVEVEPEPRDRLSSEVDVALFRIAQEALSNARKHAEASEIRVSLSFPDGVAKLVIQDNGTVIVMGVATEALWFTPSGDGYTPLCSVRQTLQLDAADRVLPTRASWPSRSRPSAMSCATPPGAC